MAASHRPGEITYYEELGVEETASAEEIRDAFRALARLLHPDQQSDPQLKDMAERQMRKLNRIYSVLSDADRRTAYDESLDEPRSTGPIVVFSNSDGNLKKLLVRISVFAAIVLVSALIIWSLATGNNTEVRVVPEAHAASGKAVDSPDDGGDQIARLRDQLRAAEAERNSALEQLARLGAKPVAGRAQSNTHATQPPPPAVTAPAPPPVSNASVAQFAGLWVFAKGSGSASPGGKSQYPPDFIELTMIAKDGALHGQYHSRYQVLDHAISPDVDFTFNGTPAGSSLSCLWQGPGGARGRMTVKLIAASTIEVAWNATELGSQQWLANGTATLIRK